MNNWQKRRKRKATSFKPTRSYVEKAVNEYLDAGGQITRIEASDANYEQFMQGKESFSSISDFFYDR